jgi:hypothetical protein
LAPFQGILGITLDQLGIKDETILTMDNLIKYVQHTSKPIGMIHLTTNDIRFVRPFNGSFDSVTIFVFLENKPGILIEQDGDPTVTISLLPETLQKIYKNAAIVPLKKHIQEDKKIPLIIGQNPIMTKRRRPLVSNKLYASPKRSHVSPKVNKTRRRPRVASK